MRWMYFVRWKGRDFVFSEERDDDTEANAKEFLLFK